MKQLELPMNDDRLADLRDSISQENLGQLFRLTQDLFLADVWASRASARALAQSMFGPSVKSALDLTNQMALAMMARMRALLDEKQRADQLAAAASGPLVHASEIDFG